MRAVPPKQLSHPPRVHCADGSLCTRTRWLPAGMCVQQPAIRYPLYRKNKYVGYQTVRDQSQGFLAEKPGFCVGSAVPFLQMCGLTDSNSYRYNAGIPVCLQNAIQSLGRKNPLCGCSKILSASHRSPMQAANFCIKQHPLQSIQSD